MNDQPSERRPVVSVVVVVYNMAREAPRTLYSLSAAYQRDIAPEDYEVIVVDNGSSPPFDAGVLDQLEGNFRLIRLDPAPKSPAHALNVGLEAARGDIIGLMIDGARMVTPGLLHFARTGVGMYPSAVVATLGWYLGLDQQRWALEGDYNKDREDQLLESINWREDGYRLFEISAADETTVDGWFGAICESNALFLSRENWTALEGVDERFDVPGGGFVNLDLIIRAYELPNSVLVILLSEGTFHQLHGGIATNASHKDITGSVTIWREQYEAIRGRPWAPPGKLERVYLGTLPTSAAKHFARALVQPAAANPLGLSFDRDLWTVSPTQDPQDPKIAALVEIARDELRARQFSAAAAVARVARKLAPDEPAVQAVIQTAAPWLSGAGDPNELGPIRRTHYFRALGRAYAILGRTDEALANYEAARQVNDDLSEIYVEMAQLRMPGLGYKDWIGRLHEDLQPRLYLEIGIAIAETFARARPPTIAIGVDPAPRPAFPLQTESHIYAETSDEFFGWARLPALCPGQAVDFAFIDGLHVFEQVLRDFINVEANCAATALIAVHDTIPFNELTQRPDRQRSFYTGDVWKLLACLRRYRPDLKIITLPTAPSGLTLIGNLDPGSRVLHDHFDEAVAAFRDHDFQTFEQNRQSILGLVPNDWASFEQHFGRPRANSDSAPPADNHSGNPSMLIEVRDRYVDLLGRMLTNTVYGDPSNRPEDNQSYDSDARQVGGDWPVLAHTMVGTLRIKNVAELTQRVLDEQIPGDFIEAGVWRGGCCIQMKGVLAANGVTDRKIYLADSFEGLPTPNVDAYPSDAGYDLTGFAQLAVSVEDVRENFRRYGLLDESIRFVKGWFSDTLPALEAGPFALIRLDGDLYESTYVSLEALYPKLSPGGFVIIDDVNFLPPCKQAVFDYRAKMGITTPLNAIDWNASWWRKE